VTPEEWFNLGGKTKWYGAALARFGAHEFGPDAAIDGHGFPFSYTEIEPYYARVERLLGVREVPVEADLERILARLQRISSEWRIQPLPLGLSPDITRHPTEAARFDGFASPLGLKADGEVSLLSHVAGKANLTVLTGHTVTALIADPARPNRVVGARIANGTTYRARNVLLAMGALHTPRILQRFIVEQRLRTLPLAELAGRRLKLHLLTAVLALSATPKHDLIRKTALLLNDTTPHSSAQPLGFDGDLLATLIPSFVPRMLAKPIGARAYGFFLQTEDASHHDNRVLDGAPPTLDYDAERSPDAAREHRRFVARFRRSLLRAGYPNFAQRIGIHGTAHACGTLAAGNDPATSAVGADGRVHGLDGLYVVDGSVLPRISRVNPALTIYAWSLRVAEHLVATAQTSRTAETVS
jgi:choline dehydrogenase-like flavoprotein